MEKKDNICKYNFENFIIIIETLETNVNLQQKIIYWFDKKDSICKKYGLIKFLYGSDIINMYDSGHVKHFSDCFYLESFHRFHGKKGDGAKILNFVKQVFCKSFFVLTTNQKLREYYKTIGFHQQIQKHVSLLGGNFILLKYI